MPFTIAGAWIGAGLLVLAGMAKVRRPDAPGRALVLAGLPGSALAVRALGIGEVLVGAAALLVGGPVWAAVALLYLGFTAFVVRERTRPTASCGCFGEEGVPLTSLHGAVDAVLAVAAVAATVLGAPGVAVVAAQPGGWVAVPLAVVGVVAVRMLLVDLPVLSDAIQAAEASS